MMQMATETESGRSGLRERFRAQVRDDVKKVALRQLAAEGPQGLSINAIAKELGVSGPALYRYFANRDALLAELVIDAYDDLGEWLAAANAKSKSRSPAERFRAVARAYRGWAIAHPHRYRLLYSEPTPGFQAHADRLVEASRHAMRELLSVVEGLEPAAATPPPGQKLSRQLKEWDRRHGLGADPAAALRAILTWARLHGIVSLEIEGNYASMGVDAERLFDIEVAALAAG